MGKPVAGEIVVVAFPLTNLQPGKRRPALVVADASGVDLILCQITSQHRGDQYAVRLTSSDFDRGKLAVDSYARINHLFTVQQSVILYTAGKVKPAKLEEVRAKLRRLFGG